MRWGSSVRSEDSARRKAAKRLKNQSTLDVLDWAQQANTSLWQALDAYRREADGAALEEARRAVSMLAGAIDVLEERATLPT